MKLSQGIALTFALLTFTLAEPCKAVIILESTYEKSGFTQAEELALSPQFKSLIYLAGSGSGSWIENHDGHGYVLTAAHMFRDKVDAKDYVYKTVDGKEYHGDKLFIHPLWNGNSDNRTGYDFAIVRLDKEVDDCGTPPNLYDGSKELGKELIFIGYGYRGAGAKGQDESIDTHDTPAAGIGIVEQVVDAVEPPPKEGDAGNYLGIWLPKEDGSIPNPIKSDGITKPTSPMTAILGSGDSGGPAWIKMNSGWVIAGINSNGTRNASYGDTSLFARITNVRDWIEEIVPSAHFVDD